MFWQPFLASVQHPACLSACLATHLHPRACFLPPCPAPSPIHHVAASAKSLQSCLTLCDPIDGSPPGSSVPGILQARTLEWAAISFSNAWKWKVKVKLLRVWLLATPWTAAYQAPPSMGFSRQEYWSGVPSPSPIHHVRPASILHHADLWSHADHEVAGFLPPDQHCLHTPLDGAHLHLEEEVLPTPAQQDTNWSHEQGLGLVCVSAGEGNRNLLQYSCLENPMDRGAWWAVVHWVAQSQTRLKRLRMQACTGEGNGNPLQCSCLENPRDGGAWWAAVYGVARSWTQVKWLSSSSMCFSRIGGVWLSSLIKVGVRWVTKDVTDLARVEGREHQAQEGVRGVRGGMPWRQQQQTVHLADRDSKLTLVSYQSLALSRMLSGTSVFSFAKWCNLFHKISRIQYT